MPENLQPELPALSEEQVELVQQIATQAVRDALAEAARQENMTPADRMRAGYAKPAA